MRENYNQYSCGWAKDSSSNSNEAFTNSDQKFDTKAPTITNVAKIGSNVVNDKVTDTMTFRIDFSETGIKNFTASDAVFSSKDSGHTVSVSDPGDANGVKEKI